MLIIYFLDSEWVKVSILKQSQNMFFLNFSVTTDIIGYAIETFGFV